VAHQALGAEAPAPYAAERAGAHARRRADSGGDDHKPETPSPQVGESLRLVSKTARVKVTDPDGQVWRISRRWVPWRRRTKGIETAAGFASIGFDLGELPVVGVLLFILLVLPLALLTALVTVEFALVLLVLPFAVLGRVLLGRAWNVEVRRGWKPWTEAPAGRWIDATVTIHQLADAVRRGEGPARTL
jgi:hypothetical protein